jgi:hypothetical protein
MKATRKHWKSQEVQRSQSGRLQEPSDARETLQQPQLRKGLPRSLNRFPYYTRCILNHTRTFNKNRTDISFYVSVNRYPSELHEVISHQATFPFLHDFGIRFAYDSSTNPSQKTPKSFRRLMQPRLGRRIGTWHESGHGNAGTQRMLAALRLPAFQTESHPDHPNLMEVLL